MAGNQDRWAAVRGEARADLVERHVHALARAQLAHELVYKVLAHTLCGSTQTTTWPMASATDQPA